MLRIYTFLRQNKAIGFVLGFSFLAIVLFLASRITLEEDVSSLIPSGEEQNILKKVLDQTRFSDKIIVSVSSTSEEANPEVLTQYAQEFMDSVNVQLPEYIKNIQGKVPEEGVREIYDFIYNNLPLFLNEADYENIESRLGQEPIQKRLENNYKNLISPTGLVTKEYLFKDPLSITALGLEKLKELQVGDDFEIYNNFLITKNQRHVLLFLTPSLPSSETDKNSIFIAGLETIQKELNQKFEGVEGDFFGGVLYSVANASQIKKDIKITIGIAVGILLLLLVYYYRRIYVPLLLFIPGLIGGITAIAILYLLKGSISAISIGIGAILLGISIDYSLHILTHYKKNRNIQKLYKEVTIPVFMSSSTTAVAFLCLLFVRSEALNDLGIFAAISVAVASVFALILIPLFYKVPEGISEDKNTFLDSIAGIEFHKKHILIIGMLLLFIGGLFFFTTVEFNRDLAAINFEPKEIKQKENRIQDIAGRASKSVHLITYGNSIDEALESNNDLYNELKELKNQEKISSFSSIGGVVLSTSTQLEKIERWKEFWTPEKINSVKSDLIDESETFGFRAESFDSFYNLLSKDFNPILLNDYRETTNLNLDDFISSREDFATVTTSVDVEKDNLELLVEKFKGKENLVVIDRQQINQSFLGNLREDFNSLIAYSLIAVFIILLFSYRSFELSIFTLLPIIITWIIALGIMALLNIQFNILNIIISTFIFGLGLDYSIFITNGFLREYETGIKVLKTYRTSILLSVITTLLGIGALFFAEHPALRSISMVSIIGVVSAVLVAFILQGYLFDLLFLNRIKKGKPALSINQIFSNSGNRYKGDKLYFKSAVYDNYRFKSVFKEVRRHFQKEKERYLKLSLFIEENDKVIHFYSGLGILPVYLKYKKPEIEIVGMEPDLEKLVIAQNCFAAKTELLNFSDSIPSEIKDFKVFILSKAPLFPMNGEIRELISKQAKTVIILDSNYVYRWIIDLDFEISYRQNDVVVLRKLE
ncbi:MAG: MMPL family transporter [Bacteroidota bacterium]